MGWFAVIDPEVDIAGVGFDAGVARGFQGGIGLLGAELEADDDLALL